MPGGFPAGFDLCNGKAIGEVTAGSTGGTHVDPSASANTNGSYVQLIASTASDCSWVIVSLLMFASGTTGATFAYDIAIGAAAAEQNIISDLTICGPTSLIRTSMSSFPICIPAGTRLSARCQASAGSESGCTISLETFDGGFAQMEGCAGVDAVGFNSTTTAGATIDPGGTANTKGSYTQLVASSARDYIGFSLGLDYLGRTAGNEAAISLDIAVGAGGSEAIIVADLSLGINSIDVFPKHSPIIGVNIPAGTRISARAQSSDNTAGVRTFGLTLYGIYL